MKNQKEGVFSAVMTVLSEVGRSIVDGVAVELSTDERKNVIGIVAAGLADGVIALSAAAQKKYPTRDKLAKGYVPGLVSNWLRKDLRLNGGTKYEAKNPGSRAGQGDEQLKNLKLLMSTLEDAEQKAKVQEAIDARMKAIQEEKASKVTIDITKIPADLLVALGYDAPAVPTVTTEDDAETDANDE